MTDLTHVSGKLAECNFGDITMSQEQKHHEIATFLFARMSLRQVIATKIEMECPLALEVSRESDLVFCLAHRGEVI